MVASISVSSCSRGPRWRWAKVSDASRQQGLTLDAAGPPAWALAACEVGEVDEQADVFDMDRVPELSGRRVAYQTGTVGIGAEIVGMKTQASVCQGKPGWGYSEP